MTTVEPKRIALKEANEQLAEAQAKLKIVNDHVANLEAKLAKLTSEFNGANAEKSAAVNAVNKGNTKLDLAQRLISALATEGERWAVTVEQMNFNRDLLTGDVLLASAFISYVGPFTKEFREDLIQNYFAATLKKEFKTAVGEEGVPPISGLRSRAGRIKGKKRGGESRRGSIWKNVRGFKNSISFAQ